MLVGDKVGVGESVGVDVGVEVGDDVEVDFGVLVGVGDGVAVDVGVNVGVGVLVGVRVGMAVAVGVAVGIAVADGVRVGESVGVDDGVLVGAGVKVGIGALIGDGVLSAPQKQPGANATGSVRNAMRITYGRRVMALPGLIQGVDRHDVERMRRAAGRALSTQAGGHGGPDERDAVYVLPGHRISLVGDEERPPVCGSVMVSHSRGSHPGLACCFGGVMLGGWQFRAVCPICGGLPGARADTPGGFAARVSLLFGRDVEQGDGTTSQKPVRRDCHEWF